jgi:predicted  nucleic acid-binding Zn-ribbon protein
LSTALPAQTLESSASEPKLLIESLRRRLLSISAYTVTLENELQSWKQLSAESEQRASELLNELAALRLELETWQSASDDSRRQATELTALWQGSEAKLKAVLESSTASSVSWRLALDQAAVERRRTLLKTALIAGSLGLVLGALATGLVIGLCFH